MLALLGSPSSSSLWCYSDSYETMTERNTRWTIRRPARPRSVALLALVVAVGAHGCADRVEEDIASSHADERRDTDQTGRSRSDDLSTAAASPTSSASPAADPSDADPGQALNPERLRRLFGRLPVAVR
jgi:hypothetical protein